MTMAPARPLDLTQDASRAPGYDIVVVPENVGTKTIYVASHPALPLVFSQGDTPEEAIESLAEVRDAFLTDMARTKTEVPRSLDFPRTEIIGATEMRRDTAPIIEGVFVVVEPSPTVHVEWRRVR